jgi:hypothetical protein
MLTYKQFSRYCSTHNERRKEIQISALTRVGIRLSQSIRHHGLVVFQIFYQKFIVCMLYCIVASRQHVDRDPNFLLYWIEKCVERPCPLGSSSINDVTRLFVKLAPSPSLLLHFVTKVWPPKMMSQTYDLPPPPLKPPENELPSKSSFHCKAKILTRPYYVTNYVLTRNICVSSGRVSFMDE